MHYFKVMYCEQKLAIVKPRMKKPMVDVISLCSYGPISIPSFISKIITGVAADQSVQHSEDYHFPEQISHRVDETIPHKQLSPHTQLSNSCH
jgi:hypothetical protein